MTKSEAKFMTNYSPVNRELQVDAIKGMNEPTWDY